MVRLSSLRYQAACSKLRVPMAWYRHRGLRPADTLLASYPRSGNSWLRFLLYEILTGGSADFGPVNAILPEVGNHAGAPALLPNSGRLLKTHERFRSLYRKAIYLVRDPRDVVLSEYAFETARGNFQADFEAFLNAFVRGRVNPFASWVDHVNSWLNSPLVETDHFLLVRFEELRRDTPKALARIVGFLGISVSPRELQRAIEDNCLQRMRDKEDRQPGFKAMAEAGERFVRAGSVGGWRKKLSGPQIHLIQRHAGAAMSRLGYPTDSPRAANRSASGRLLQEPLPQR